MRSRQLRSSTRAEQREIRVPAGRSHAPMIQPRRRHRGGRGRRPPHRLPADERDVRHRRPPRRGVRRARVPHRPHQRRAVVRVDARHREGAGRADRGARGAGRRSAAASRAPRTRTWSRPIATAARPRTSTPRPTIRRRSGSAGSGWRSSSQRMDAAIVIEGGARDLPQAARDPQGRRHRLRHPRHQDRPGVPGARPPRLRVHDQRDLVRAPRRGRRVAHRGDDARGEAGRRPHRLRRRPGRRPHRRRRLLLRSDPRRLRRRAARGQRARRPRRRAGALRHVARRRHGERPRDRRRPPPPHARDQRDLPRRRPARGGRQRRADVRRDVRVHPPQRRLRPRRQHPRRRPAARHDHEPGRGAGPLHRRAAGREARARAVDDAARHRRRQHAAGVGAAGVRGHQPGGRHQARRPRIVADDRHRHRRRPVPATAGVGALAEVRTSRTCRTSERCTTGDRDANDRRSVLAGVALARASSPASRLRRRSDTTTRRCSRTDAGASTTATVRSRRSSRRAR